MASVLVLDDDLARRAQIDEALVAEGWRVRSAGRTNFGMALAAKECPDLVLLDVEPPSHLADALATALRIHCGPTLPIAAMAGIAEPDLMRRIGAFGFLRKPVEQDRIAALLERATALVERNASLRVRSVEAPCRLDDARRRSSQE